MIILLNVITADVIFFAVLMQFDIVTIFELVEQECGHVYGVIRFSVKTTESQTGARAVNCEGNVMVMTDAAGVKGGEIGFPF